MTNFVKTLEQELLAAYDRRSHSRGTSPWKRASRRSVGLTLAATFAVCSAATAAYLAIDANRDLPRAVPEEPQSLSAVPGTGVIAARAADPAGGSPWVVRVYRNRRGERCTQVGQLANGTVGLVTRQGLRRSSSGSCGATGTLPAVMTIIDDAGEAPPRTIVSGFAKQRYAAVEIAAQGLRRRAAVSPYNAYIAVLPAALTAEDIKVFPES